MVVSHSKSSHRPTIGILTARLSGPTEIDLWHGVADRALERGINIIFFSGGIPHQAQFFETQRNLLFKLAGEQNVDGLLVWANVLGHNLGRAGMDIFFQQYTPLPIVSMGILSPSIPSIRIDMGEGMRRLLFHLIEVHGRRKIAFIRGPEASQDAEERYKVYLETLGQYHLPIEPGLISSGDFRRYSGEAAVYQLLDHQSLRFDALVSANDNMAIGAMQALQARGVRIPEDVIVAGFDDIEETRAVTPTLTTVRTPWHLLGSKSLDLVLANMVNEPLLEPILLETELICRQSCGCQLAMVDITNKGMPAGNSKTIVDIQKTPPAELRLVQKALPKEEDDLDHAMASIQWIDQDFTRKLVDDFLTDVTSRGVEAKFFLKSLMEILSGIPSGTEIIEWQNVLHVMRSKVDKWFTSDDQVIKAHQLLENAYGIVGDVAHHRQLSERLEALNQTNRLNRIVQMMSTTHNIEALMNLLAMELPHLGIHSCFLSLYDESGDPPFWSRLLLAMVGDQRLPLAKGGVRFPTRQLVPEGFLPQERQFGLDMEALFFQDEQIGFVLFEIGPRDGEVYSTLQGHISSALKSAELVQIALEAEAKAVKSDQLKTHLLANVSHELRTPLNIILGISQSAISSPNSYGAELSPQLAKDLGYIYDSGEHLIRLINDLLDTSRAEIGELDLCYEPVSLQSLVKEVFESFTETPSFRQMAIKFILELPDHLPVLNADPVRVRQILMNLVSNAFKFTKKGQIILGADVELPHIHFWVSDTGSGIAPELQERIFEPFVKAEPPGRQREGIGLGLSITRRLVALHGGTITLDSIPGQGSTFHVYLPLPGLDFASAKEVPTNGEKPVLLWLSSKSEPAPGIVAICKKNGLTPAWIANRESLDRLVADGKPVALAWDLENTRPGDWSIVQRLRSHSQYCQLPLLIFHEKILDTPSGGSRLTNVLLKPAGKQMLQHVLNLMPEALQCGVIWVIDDDPQALKYYQEMISNSLSEFKVRTIQGGKEAFRQLDEETPDLVLLDLVMPEVDGFQVLEHLRRNTKTAQIPVIIITGKILTYEDVRRLDVPKVILQTKGVYSDAESIAEIQQVLNLDGMLPQATATLVKQASAYIQQNYTRSFSLEELAETIGVSKSYLSRIFKQGTGISPWNYLNRFRIQKAKEFLLLTNESITSIAANIGYEDAGYFTRVFREIAGCSPRQFRQQDRPSSS